MNEMQSTVDAGDGSRYGLRWTPPPCRGGYWTHGGNGVGYTTFAGATSAGRAVSVAVFSRTFDPVEGRTPGPCDTRAHRQCSVP